MHYTYVFATPAQSITVSCKDSKISWNYPFITKDKLYFNFLKIVSRPTVSHYI